MSGCHPLNYVTLENNCKSYFMLEEKINKLTNRLKELEEWTRKDEDRIYERIDKLESKISTLDFNNWMALIQDLEKKMQSKLDNMMEIFKCNWAADQSRKSIKPRKFCLECGKKYE